MRYRLIDEQFLKYMPEVTHWQYLPKSPNETPNQSGNQLNNEGLVSEWQLCPKCAGKGFIYTTEGHQTSTTDLCDVCNGAKILAKPIFKPQQLANEP